MKTSFLLVILFSHITAAQGRDVLYGLSAVDQKVFFETSKKCQGGSWKSAIQLGFNLNNLNSSVESSLRILSAEMLFELEARRKNKGLSAEVYQLRHSQGFWLALTECYGYRYGEANRGLLVKQLVDLGHLTTEVLGAVAGVGIVRAGAAIWSAARAQYPLAVSFVAAGISSIIVSNLIKQLYYTHPTSMTPQEKQYYQELERKVFSEADTAILETVKRTQERVSILEKQLHIANLSATERKKIEDKILEFKGSLAKLRRLNPNLFQI